VTKGTTSELKQKKMSRSRSQRRRRSKKWQRSWSKSSRLEWGW